ncbi:hypothetical protein OC834_005647 [Tilletia horrida]|nr:hypothetical protein OC834_005647 [Tilletia horrida]KAK0524636.1 hypothetical protein OC835_005862 [Tilletia horrida]KAK0567145.1 hypothetical protein OC844_000390 [Tilletia horrida]
MPNEARASAYPTTFTLTGDIIFTDKDEATLFPWDRAIFFDEEGNDFLAHLIPGPSTPTREDGWYTIRHMRCSTRPFKLVDNGDDHVRKVPEEVDGSHHTKEVMDWTNMSASGIAVLKDIDSNRKKGNLMGLSFLGTELGWNRFDLRFKCADELDIPQPTKPFPLVSFEGIIHKHYADGIPEIHATHLLPLAQADDDLVRHLTDGWAKDIFVQQQETRREL